MKSGLGFAASLIAWLCMSAAQAGRPLVTDDAGVMDRGVCEFESFAMRRSERGLAAPSGLSLQVGCATITGTQWALTTTHSFQGDPAGGGIGVSTKTALNTPDKGQTAYALAMGVVAVRRPGGGLAHELSSLNGVATIQLSEALKLHANLGWTHARSARQATTTWALALEHPLSARIDLMAEAFANDRDKSPWLQVAVRWSLAADKLYLDASLGQQAHATRARVLTIGMKAVF